MKKAQANLEYSLLIACMIAALAGMSIYIKRGISGSLKEAGDGMGSQYEPGNTITTSPIITTYSLDGSTTLETKGGHIEYDDGTTAHFGYFTTRTEDIEEERWRQGTEEVGKFSSSLFK